MPAQFEDAYDAMYKLSYHLVKRWGLDVQCQFWEGGVLCLAELLQLAQRPSMTGV